MRQAGVSARDSVSQALADWWLIGEADLAVIGPRGSNRATNLGSPGSAERVIHDDGGAWYQNSFHPSAVARGARMHSTFVLPTTYCALGGSAAGGRLSVSSDRNCTGARGANGWRLLSNRSAADFVQCGRDDAFTPMWT